MECPKCFSQVGENKEGISKKPGKNFGKPWKGWKCSGCGDMQFINLPRTAQASQVSHGAQIAPDPLLKEILAVLKQIRKHLIGQSEPSDQLPPELRTYDEEGF